MEVSIEAMEQLYCMLEPMSLHPSVGDRYLISAVVAEVTHMILDVSCNWTGSRGEQVQVIDSNSNMKNVWVESFLRKLLILIRERL